MRYAFDIRFIDQEVPFREIRGRVDSMFGATLFEFKKDLRNEYRDVLDKMPDYLAEAERQQRRRFLGIATDGATWIAYEMRAGALAEMSRFELRPGGHAALLGWLGPVASERDDLHPEPLAIQRELGRDSLTYRRALPLLQDAWAALRTHPEVALKRDLWAGLLREVYGAPLGDDGLFLQHTYLTIVAKTMAARVLDLPADDAGRLLSGQALADAGILGAVESDFFDWVLESPAGRDLVPRVAKQAARFRLRDAQMDVLKALYESLIDPVLLGESLAPFRVLRTFEAVLPIEGRALLNENAARDAGHRRLADWLRDIDAKWATHAAKRADGTPKMTVNQRLDHMRGLTQQLGPAEHRVAYSASGTWLTGCRYEDPATIVEHKAYWTSCRSSQEALYVVAVLNCGEVVRAIAPSQSRGQGGARDFDNLMWELPIPDYDAREALHAEIAALGAEAENVSASVPLDDRQPFGIQRRAIRDALAADGIAARIDGLVAKLLDVA